MTRTWLLVRADGTPETVKTRDMQRPRDCGIVEEDFATVIRITSEIGEDVELLGRRPVKCPKRRARVEKAARASLMTRLALFELIEAQARQLDELKSIVTALTGCPATTQDEDPQ